MILNYRYLLLIWYEVFVSFITYLFLQDLRGFFKCNICEAFIPFKEKIQHAEIHCPLPYHAEDSEEDWNLNELFSMFFVLIVFPICSYPESKEIIPIKDQQFIFCLWNSNGIWVHSIPFKAWGTQGRLLVT